MPTAYFKIICLADMQRRSFEVYFSTILYRCNLLIKNHSCRHFIEFLLILVFLLLLLPLSVEKLGLLAGAWGRLIDVHHISAAAGRHILMFLLMIATWHEVTCNDDGRAGTFFFLLNAANLLLILPHFRRIRLYFVIIYGAVELIVCVLWLAKIACPRSKPSVAHSGPPTVHNCQLICARFVELHDGSV